jgi:hypothetical protein
MRFFFLFFSFQNRKIPCHIPSPFHLPAPFDIFSTHTWSPTSVPVRLVALEGGSEVYLSVVRLPAYISISQSNSAQPPHASFRMEVDPHKGSLYDMVSEGKRGNQKRC